VRPIERLVVIADDLTGANDTGVQFAKKGLSTTVLFTNCQLKAPQLSNDVTVLNSDSRALENESAYEIVSSISKEIRRLGISKVFKKIDSTMRGNIGREIDAVMDVFHYKAAFVIPAFPKSKRITINGQHFVDGVPLEETDIANDPTCAVKEGFLPKLVASQSKREVGLVSIEQVRSGKEKLSAHLQEIAMQPSSKIMIIDATTDEELMTIAEAIQELEENILTVGSAGIAYHFCNGTETEEKSILNRNETKLPVLVVAGSVSSVTERQVQALKGNTKIEEIIITPEKFFYKEERQKEIDRAVEAGKRSLKQANLVVSTNRSLASIDRVRVIQQVKGLSNVDIGRTIANAMGEIAGRLIESNDLLGVALTGGDIAGATCTVLNGNGIHVIGEVEDGIPFGHLFGGKFDELPIVTKAGAFGSDEALIKAVHKITEIHGKQCNGDNLMKLKK
jgi:uncharacterized protein YgbK (DUF1537 family)